MSRSNLRNIAIVLAIAAAVWALPGGGRAANLVAAVLSVLFAAGLGFFAARMYLEHRVALHGLGDRHRGLLYGAIALVFVTLAATPRLTSSGPGTIVWLALLAAAVYAGAIVFRYSRSY
ncbi:MAG TPA: hypothetical protein VGN69_06745 [Solirubrobacteraceae bacterium]|nr:hypothetical protein [Solirubrobacteraceae bacterium]